MKIFVFLYFIPFCLIAQVGIGTETPSDASMLDVNSTLDSGTTYKGFMPPRIPLASDLTKINAGINDVGLQVFVLETGCLMIWDGANWQTGTCITIVSGSEVQFADATQSQGENVASISFDFIISNPSTTDAIVVSISADSYTDIDENTSQTITIPAGATSYTATGVFNITNDSTPEANEDVVFTAAIVSGGLGTTVMGTQSTNTLTIVDDDSALTIPFQESFETDGNGTRYATSIPEAIDGADYFSRGEENDFQNVTLNGTQDGTYLFAAQDIDGVPGAPAALQTLTISNIDIVGETNLLLEILLAEDDQGTSNEHWDGPDFFHFDYSIDGAPFVPLLWVESLNGTNNEPSIDADFNGIGDGTIFITDTWSNFARTFPTGGGTSLTIRLSMNFNSADEDIAIDNIRIVSN